MIVDSTALARAGSARHRRLRLPERGPALLGAARPLRPARDRGADSGDAVRRHGRASHRRPRGTLPPTSARSSTTTREIASKHTAPRREREGRRAQASCGAGGRHLRADDGARGRRHRGAQRGNLRAGAARRDLRRRRDRCRPSMPSTGPDTASPSACTPASTTAFSTSSIACARATSTSIATRSARWWARNPSAARA